MEEVDINQIDIIGLHSKISALCNAVAVGDVRGYKLCDDGQNEITPLLLQLEKASIKEGVLLFDQYSDALIKVDGVECGTIANPDIARLTSMANPAPFGKGASTLYDETVRKGLQITANRIAIEDVSSSSPGSYVSTSKTNSLMLTFQRGYNNILDLFQTYKDSPTLQLYKIHIYKEGGFFDEHIDTQINHRHVGTFIFPIGVDTYEGGEFQVGSGLKLGDHPTHSVKIRITKEDPPSTPLFNNNNNNQGHGSLPNNSSIPLNSILIPNSNIEVSRSIQIPLSQPAQLPLVQQPQLLQQQLSTQEQLQQINRQPQQLSFGNHFSILPAFSQISTPPTPFFNQPPSYSNFSSIPNTHFQTAPLPPFTGHPTTTFTNSLQPIIPTMAGPIRGAPIPTFKANYLAMFNDCPHRVLPVTKGTRMVLQFNVIMQESDDFYEGVIKPNSSAYSFYKRHNNHQKADEDFPSLEEVKIQQINQSQQSKPDDQQSFFKRKADDESQLLKSDQDNNHRILESLHKVIDEYISEKGFNIALLLQHQYKSNVKGKDLKGVDQTLYSFLKEKYNDDDDDRLEVATLLVSSNESGITSFEKLDAHTLKYGPTLSKIHTIVYPGSRYGSIESIFSTGSPSTGNEELSTCDVGVLTAIIIKKTSTTTTNTSTSEQ